MCSTMVTNAQPPLLNVIISKLVANIRLSQPPLVTEDEIVLYTQAIMGHSSEVLEFVGNSALNHSATLWLRQKYPHEDVGRLTNRREIMVGNNTGLMELANHFGLERFVDGEFYRGGKRLLPNIVEAIVGAMQQLNGFEYADAFLVPLFDELAESWFDSYLPKGEVDIAKSVTMATHALQTANNNYFQSGKRQSSSYDQRDTNSDAPTRYIPNTSALTDTSNHKGALLTYYQRGMIPCPVYSFRKEGPMHAPIFIAEVKVGNEVCFGRGQKKIEAEQNAAKDILSCCHIASNQGLSR